MFTNSLTERETQTPHEASLFAEDKPSSNAMLREDQALKRLKN